jgi:hypothetical protein
VTTCFPLQFLDVRRRHARSTIAEGKLCRYNCGDIYYRPLTTDNDLRCAVVFMAGA